MEKSPNGGEEFKNQLFVKQLHEKGYNIDVIDTIYWRTSPFIVINLLVKIFFASYNKIILSASSKSVYRLIRIIYFLNKKKLSKIIYFVIGGYFPDALIVGIYNYKYYRGLNKIVVEGEILKKKVVSVGLISNVIVIPNFKETIKFQNLLNNVNIIKQNKFLYISTISAEKGVDLLFEAIDLIQLNPELHFDYQIDFYGPVEETYKEKFEKKLRQYSEFVSYKGYLDIMKEPQNSYSVISTYEALIFPTLYKGEGFPGVIIDSYIAGIPVITTKWNMNEEIVENEFNGIILTQNNALELSRALISLSVDKNRREKMSTNNKEKAHLYDINYIFTKNIYPLLE